MKGICAAFLVFLASASHAYACSCTQSTFDESFKRVPFVAKATVVKSVDSDKVQLQLDDIWKGNAPKEVIVKLTTGLSASCSPTGITQPEAGTEYLFYTGSLKADGNDVIHLGACSRNRLYKDLQADVPLLEAYRQKLQAVDAAIKSSGNSKESKYKKVLFLRDYGDTTNAIGLLKSITKQSPDYGDAWAQLASLTYEQADVGIPYPPSSQRQDGFSEALQYAEKAISAKSTKRLAYDIKQIALIQLGRANEANLENTDLSKRQIWYQVFTGKEFKKTSFVSTQLFGIDFAQAVVNGALFQKSRIMRSRFFKAQITNTNFDEAEISSSVWNRGEEILQFKLGGFEESTVKDSSFKKTRFRAPIANTSFDNSNFEEASFEAGYGEGEQILMANVKANSSNFKKITTGAPHGKLAEFRDSAFVKSDFSGAKIAAKITGTDFSQAILTDIDLSGSTFDCKTKWPAGFDPGAYGAVPEGTSCDGKPIAAANYSGKDFGSYHGFGPINLENANFTYARLPGASLTKVNLKGADFSNAVIENADFREANLENAKLRNVKLYGVNFDGANLKNTDFAGADFSNASFGTNTNLKEAKLTLARIKPEAVKNFPKSFDASQHQLVYWANKNNQSDPPPCASFGDKKIEMPGADLTGITLAYSCLRGANFQKAKLDKATIYSADLTNAQLDGASFVGAKYGCDTILPPAYQSLLSKMILIETMGSCHRSGLNPPTSNLAGADLSRMNLYYAQLSNADLSNANLTGANLASANLIGAKLTGAKLQGAIFNKSTQWPTGFDYKAAGAVEEVLNKNSFMGISME